MRMQVSCPCCHNTGTAPADYLNRPIRCKRCNSRFLVLTAPTEQIPSRSAPQWPDFLEDMPPVLVDTPVQFAG